MMPLRRAIKLLLVKNIPTPITCSWNKDLGTSSQMDTLIFLAPSDLLTSPQSDLLKGWLKEGGESSCHD